MPSKPSSSTQFPPRNCPKCGGNGTVALDCSLCEGLGVVSHFRAAMYLAKHDTDPAPPHDDEE